jgi:NADH-quinone oxidoreductase subunit L
MTHVFLEHMWIIPVLPALGAVLMLLFGKRMSKGAVSTVGVGVVALAFLFAVGAVWQYGSYAEQADGRPFETVMYTWMGTETGQTTYALRDGSETPFNIQVGFLLDPLSAVWLLFVTGVGMLIHIYSIGYMAHEGGYYRFFGYLNLFMFAMLILILANNYVMLFVGWEGVGLCSYLLIGFYFHKHSASTAANKAFIVNRVGDAAFLLGMFTIAWYLGSVRFTTLAAQAASGDYAVGDPVLTVATLLLFLGACGKSAQVPLHVWLPDAMEGPTPVSALIHAATMVTAGVYMVARSNALFVLAPETMKLVALVGLVTAIFAASIALVQNDIKRVLAYSTVSQLGYMFLALGIGAFAAGVFHVFTHAFFKALLFLGAGSVIHAMSGEQDMQHMGGLRKKIPVTFATMLIATLAIAGIPPLAGFVSKDEILWQSWVHPAVGYRLFWVIAFATAMMTAFYMFRLLFLTFWGEGRMSHEVEHHIHESPKSMTGPLVVLAGLSIFAGFLGWPHALGGHNRFGESLGPVFGASAEVMRQAEPEAMRAAREAALQNHAVEYALMALSVLGVLFMAWLAWRTYSRATKGYTEPIREMAPPVYNTLYNKYWVDEAYGTLFVGDRKLGKVRLGALGASNALWKFDDAVLDGGVNGAAWVTRLWGSISGWWDKWVIDGAMVHAVPMAAYAAGLGVRLLQWGLVQVYALLMVAGLLGFGLYYWLR